MQRFPFSTAPRVLSRPGTRLDHVALVLASLLPFKRQGQRVANGMRQGSVLLCSTTSARQQTTPTTPLQNSLRRRPVTLGPLRAV
jgi:hypothetical protein